MAFEEKNILQRLYIVAAILFLFVLGIVFKIVNIQFVEGEHYRELAKISTTKQFVLPANRGNVYADDGSLLATSMPMYDIRFDAMTVSQEVFDQNVVPLSQALARKFGRPASHYQQLLRTARANGNRYQLIQRRVSSLDYLELRKFPMFNLGPFRGGIIAEQYTVRQHPIGRIAERTVGYERVDQDGNTLRVGIEGAFSGYLSGVDGRQMRQRIAQGQWKPIYDANEIEPRDGYDVVSTININIQDIAHHALLKQLEHYQASHGTVIVMETQTGNIKAVSNLGRTPQGTYFERLNYAIGESHEPGSTFKTMVLTAVLEDKVADTATIIDTGNGVFNFYGSNVRDSNHQRGGHGKVSLARSIEVSSNIAIARVVHENYKDNPARFIELLRNMKLDQKLDLPIVGEGEPKIPHPDDKNLWSRRALPSMAYGYGVSLTPLQTLTFYNAIANNGTMVKPRFVTEIRSMNQTIKSFDTEIIHPQIASQSTINKVQAILANAVKRGTGRRLYSPDFSMAGKTGTAQTEYWMSDWAQNPRYISSFVGYFPAENPKYSCIVVIHKPQVGRGYYGSDVAGPVFKSIAQKIYVNSPEVKIIENLDILNADVVEDFFRFDALAQNDSETVPNVIGMAGMDAVSLLENLGLKVVVNGNGRVVSQSLPQGSDLNKNQQIVLKLSS